MLFLHVLLLIATALPAPEKVSMEVVIGAVRRLQTLVWSES